MGDSYNVKSYVWIQEYIWPKLEPALVEVARDVRDHDANVWMQVRSHTSQSYPFSGYAVFEKRILNLFRLRDVGLYFNCGFCPVSLPDLQRIECRSYAAKRDGHILENGPNVVLALGDDARIRHELDLWVDAAVRFIERSNGIVIDELK